MTAVTDHDQVENSVAALVLDACEDDAERAAARAHIDACASCRELARRLGRTVEALPLATELVAPPARLRHSILAAAAASGRVDSGERRPPAKVLALPRRLAAETAASRARGRFRLAGFRFPAYPAAVAALTVGFLSLAAWNVNQGPRHYSLTGSGQMSGTQGNVTAFNRDSITLVSFHGLTQPEPGRVYELWLIAPDGRPTQGAVFTPDGHGAAQLVLNQTLQGVQSLAVTEESGPDGVRAPTQRPQMVGRLG